MPTTINPYTSAVHRSVGHQTFTAISDGYFETDLGTVFPFFDLDEAARLQQVALRPVRPRITHNAYVVQSQHHAPVLIDAGMGEGWGPTMGHAPTGLAAIGVTPAEVGTVLLTHLHLDHCAGLIDENGQARYPNAEIVVHANEANYWLSDTPHLQPTDEPPWADAVTRFYVARSLAPYLGRIRTFNGSEDILPGITSMPIIGHTPGHSGYLVGSVSDAVLAVGDLMHLPAVQAPRTDASVVFDVDPVAAAKARAEFLDEFARSGRSIAGAHTEFPGIGRVERVGDGYRIVPELWAATLP